MADRKKKIRRMLRGLLKVHGMESFVSFRKPALHGFEFAVRGVPDFLEFSLERFINERIDNYEACTYEDLNARMALFNKEIIYAQTFKSEEVDILFYAGVGKHYRDKGARLRVNVSTACSLLSLVL